MHTHRTWILLSFSLIVILVLAAFTAPVRGVVQNGTPGGFLSIPQTTFIDSATGQEFSIIAVAGESEETAGVGNVTLQLGGTVSACSVHGGGADIGPVQDDGNYAGNFPMTEIQCGTAFGMAVSIEGCTVRTESHGFSHSDYPFTTYMGSTTIDFNFKQTASGGKVEIKIYTPKGPIKLAGTVNGPITLNTCE